MDIRHDSFTPEPWGQRCVDQHRSRHCKYDTDSSFGYRVLVERVNAGQFALYVTFNQEGVYLFIFKLGPIVAADDLGAED